MYDGLKQTAAVIGGKVVGDVSRRLGRGGGTTMPGVVASAVYPGVIGGLAKEIACGTTLISGTNGKTTTARLLGQICREAGLDVLQNASGSNLARGISAALVENADWSGHLRSRARTMGVFEADEAALPHLLPIVKPEQLVLLDLFRDQLDRYGEVASVADAWSRAISSLGRPTRLIVNADDPLVAGIALAQSTHETLWFGLEVPGAESADYGGDVKLCPRCGREVAYARVTFGHLGDYACRCGFKRPHPCVSGSRIEDHGLSGSNFWLTVNGNSAHVALPLPGLYNVANAVAAAAAATALGIEVECIARALARSSAAFGRTECVAVEGRRLYLFLAKNPAGYNQVLRTIFRDDRSREPVLFMLNDRPADGRDVSWIWDVDFERIVPRLGPTVVGGTRAEDMALRLKYAGWPRQTVPPLAADAASGLGMLLRHTRPGGTCYAIATYTALLDLRTVLTAQGHARPYWEM